MREKVWKIISKYTNQITSINDVLNIVFENRSLTSPTSINSFINPSLSIIDFEVGDVHEVVLRIKKAIEKKEKIIVYGDYDADGITATAIMWETLYSLGANAKPYIPHREKEGYGLSIYGVDHLIEEEKVELIITVDQGISAKTQIEYAQSKGVEVIITDHHTKPAKVAENCLIVHDSRVCGAGVSWKVATELLRDFSKTDSKIGIDKKTNLPIKSQQLLELVAIGMVCDLIPLTGEARALVTHGIEQLRRSTRPGIIAIAKQAGVQLPELQAYHIGYIIGPRLNAMGRLEHAIDSLRLLCTTNQQKADDLAQRLNVVNTDRKDLTLQMINIALKQAQQQASSKLLVIGDETWNPGVIGLVASRMVEEYYKPTIVWGSSSDHPDLYKASARSIKGFNIISAISEFQQHLESHGGHPMAAGFSLKSNVLSNFSKDIQQFANIQIKEELLKPTLDIDCQLPLNLASEELYQEIQKLKPFGIQAEEPVFATQDVEVVDCMTMGSENKHLRLKVIEPKLGYKPYEAVAFNFGEYSSKIRPGNPIKLAYNLDINEWNGKKKLQLKIRDIKV